MRVLLTNDDGIHAEGLAVLERIALSLTDDVWVVAPEMDQSGYAHSLSLSTPLRLRSLGEKKFALRGTPADCVIMGVRNLLPEPPQLILSGVNSGANIADDIFYSGTVAGAMEGAMLGIPSIAISQERCVDSKNNFFPYETCQSLAPDLLQKLISLKLPEGVFLNVNYPPCTLDLVKGVKVTAQGRLIHSIWTEERHDGRGIPYFWLRSKGTSSSTIEGTDVFAIENNFVSVTPLHLDLTAHNFKNELNMALEENKNQE